uniref:Serine hydroxymethyltransferase n=1 Tax=Meloidogyne hapla TaxID=6305 RepID=A0A1I8C223_MELHA
MSTNSSFDELNGFNSSVPVEREDYKGNSILKDSVDIVDPEIYALLKKEKERQKLGIHLIASENFTSKAVSETVGSSLTNKYSEGYPGVRYYGGNEYIDQVENICQKRALKLFGLNSEKWGVNVQALSGSPANFAVYTAIVEPHGRLMGLELTDGGHLTHGFFSPTKKVSATSLFFESMPYRVNPNTGLIDYDLLEQNALLFRPKLIIAGISCYAQLLDYKRFREIAVKCGAYLMADMAHIAGLVAGGAIPSPFNYADIVTTTTHKTLRGPRGALIFFRKGVKSINNKGEKTFYDFETKINSAVFPGLQGGPHNHSIAAIAVALKQCLTNEFVEYSHQILKNAKTLSKSLQNKGYTLITGGTQTHLCLLDLRPKHLDAARIEHILDLVHIVTNKNTCPGDKSALRPGGIRLGTPAMTSRGLKEKDFEQIAEFINKAIEIYQKNEEIFVKAKTLKDFKQIIANNENFKNEINLLGKEIIEFSKRFDLPGGDDI